MNMRGLPAIQYYVTGGQIDDIYQNLFGREADAGGKAYYEDLLGNASMADAIAIISGGAARGSADDIAQQDISDTSDYGTVTDYIVNQAYEDTLDRGVDPGGYDYYTQAIQSGMDPTLLDDQLARSNEAVSNLGADKAQQAWEDATAFQNWNQMGIDYPGVYNLYSELRGPTGYISPDELQSYQNIFGNEISPEERDAFFRGAVASGEITEDELSKFLDTAGGTDTTGTTLTTPTTPTTSTVPIGAGLRTPGLITYPSTAINNLPPIAMPQFLPVGGLATRATKPYDAGATLQGPTGLFRPVTTGAPPTLMMPVAEGAPPTAEGMAEGGMAKATPAELGSKFDISEFMDEGGRLVGGYSRPIRDEFGVITGYDYRPYESDIVFGEELRSREAARQMTPEERARALLNMQVMSGRTGVSPIRGGLQGIEVRGPASRATPRYYPFAKGGDVSDVAQDLASRGRGGDTMLVHMAPHEVAGLRALAKSQGTELTINPETGMPEALKLGKLFKTLAPFIPFIPGVGQFMAPMYASLGLGGLSGLAQGAITSGIIGGFTGPKKGFDFQRGLTQGIMSYGIGSVMQNAGMTPGTSSGPATVAPDMGGVNVTGDVTGVPGEIPSPSELGQFQGVGGEPGVSTNIYGTYSDTAGGIQTQPRVSIVPETTAPGSIGEPMSTEKALLTTALAGSSQAQADQANAQLAKAASKKKKEEEDMRKLFYATLGKVPVYGKTAMGASGGLAKLAGGGMTYMEAGGTTGPTGTPREVVGTGDGMSDSVPADIEGVQEARLADGEFVIPADVVADIGNGSSDAGSKKLYAMMDRIREARHGTTEQPPEINAERMMPA